MTAAAFFAFLAGLLLGIGVCWGYVRILRGKIKLYESYIHERLDKQFATRIEASEAPDPDQTSAEGPGSH